MADVAAEHPDSDGLNLKQVAARLGVHYMTAYRYVRTGRLHATKVGTAWVVSTEALAAFLADEAGPEVADSPVPVDWTARLRSGLLDGDEPTAWRVIEQALASGRSPADCYLDLIVGALATIGADLPDPSRHPAGATPDAAAAVAGGYVATAVATRLVARLGARFRRPGRSRGTVVFGAPRGEQHGLPIAIVADLVRLEGFTCLELGVDVPPQAFVGAATNAERLVAVGIGVSSAEHLAAVRATVEAVNLALPAVPVLLGGQGVLNPDIAQLAGATHWAADGRAAIAAVQAIAVERHTSPEGRTTPTTA